MTDDPHSKFGETIAGSRWFNREPVLTNEEMVPVRQTWICPTCGEGEMIASRGAWLTNPPGHHHECTKCKFTAALRNGAKYPSITYIPKSKYRVSCQPTKKSSQSPSAT